MTMTTKIYFQNSVSGEPSYTAEDFSKFFGHFVSNGILYDKDDGAGFATSFASDSTKDSVKVSVQPGAVCTGGKMLVFTEAETLSVGTVGGQALVRYISVVYNTQQKTVALSATETEPTKSETCFPIAKITVYPKALSAYTDIIEDLRQSTGYVFGILETSTTYETILDTAYDNVNTLIQEYQALAQKVDETGSATILSIYSQTITPTDLTNGSVSLDLPETATAILWYDLYLNGRLYTGDKITVNTATKTVNFSKFPAGNDVIIIVFYEVGESNG